MKKLIYVKGNDKTQNIELSILNNYEITKSSQDITFSDITCDFTNKTVDDLPEKYQEVKIIDSNTNKIDFFGYVDTYNFGEMRETDVFREINFTLLSPMKLATLRSVIAIGYYNVKELIENIILKPLINDGFEINVLNVPNRNLTVNFLSQTIEYCMNALSNEFNLWWFIDENKKIYVQDINELLNKEPNHIYDDEHKINGLQYIKPTIASQNYANVINFSNVRVYEKAGFNSVQDTYNIKMINEQITGLKTGQELLFNYPVDIKKENILKSGKSHGLIEHIIGLSVTVEYTDDSVDNFNINSYYEGLTPSEWSTSNNVGFKGDEDTEKDFLLIRDSFFNNLIVGFEYNGNKTIRSIQKIETDSALIWEVFRFYNDKAINEKKEIINNTGIVELTVDMNEQWKLSQELQNMAINFINNNSLKIDGEIELKLDKNIFKIGDILKINKMLFNDKYIVTEIKENFNNKVIEYFVTCKNANIINSYIDLFRPSSSEISDDKIYQINVSHYTEEGIKETFEVIQ